MGLARSCWWCCSSSSIRASSVVINQSTAQPKPPSSRSPLPLSPGLPFRFIACIRHPPEDSGNGRAGSFRSCLTLASASIMLACCGLIATWWSGSLGRACSRCCAAQPPWPGGSTCQPTLSSSRALSCMMPRRDPSPSLVRCTTSLETLTL